MTEIKTFKDCKDKEEAREEAVKLVKRWNYRLEEYPTSNVYEKKQCFMEFFNITEEELK